MRVTESMVTLPTCFSFLQQCHTSHTSAIVSSNGYFPWYLKDPVMLSVHDPSTIRYIATRCPHLIQLSFQPDIEAVREESYRIDATASALCEVVRKCPDLKEVRIEEKEDIIVRVESDSFLKDGYLPISLTLQHMKNWEKEAVVAKWSRDQLLPMKEYGNPYVGCYGRGV
ncbi:hypothetical protein K469DRAFT_691397 [Zopfia rhizophila CBS 207.26]|uniref:Uncharacterized protein n=1 Tax=Zopfia rhizophila CBS 207.26 TaxID=1314779 RepID=A0A6A6DSW1_9PEZI|nr:hypothetical protein K469DRAFT_691397 [Zopfia rhizophila CBS 207.26]